MFHYLWGDLCCRHTYFWNEDKSNNHCRPQRQAQPKQDSIEVRVFLQQEAWDNSQRQENTGHVDGSCNVQGVIDSFDLHLAGGEGQDEGDKLQETFVAIYDSEDYGIAGGLVTDQNVVIFHDPKHL